MSKGKLKIYGLIGYPLEHSLSPLMHNFAFSYLKLKAEYRLFPLREEELENFFNSLSKRNIFGLNVTIPYKEKVIPYIDWLSPGARFIGAVNTILVEKKNYLKGYNTDGIGFSRHLIHDLKFNPEGKNVLILGAGGAAKAITYQLTRRKVSTIIIYDIDKNKAENLKEKLKQEEFKCKVQRVDSLKEVDFKNIHLLINATPCGMKENDPCLIEKEMLHKDILVYDLIYNPAQTKLLKLAQSVGAKTSNGLGMLLYQGARAFELFTQKKAPLKIMKQALEKGVEKCL